MSPWIFVVGGIVWLLVLVVAVALARAAAIGDELADIERLPFRPRVVENEHAEFSPGLAPVVSIHSRRRDRGGRAA